MVYSGTCSFLQQVYVLTDVSNGRIFSTVARRTCTSTGTSTGSRCSVDYSCFLHWFIKIKILRLLLLTYSQYSTVLYLGSLGSPAFFFPRRPTTTITATTKTTLYPIVTASGESFDINCCSCLCTFFLVTYCRR
jgi:hypothetical protein